MPYILLPIRSIKPATCRCLLLCAFIAILPAFSSVAYSGDVWRDATVYRDEWGVPHIFANNPFALGFAFGYSQAEDHAEQMLLAYRMANGQLAEIFGEQYAESDAFSLKMGHAQLAEEAFPYLDTVTQSLCEGFSMGVNSWLVDNTARVPAWADGMKPADILALWHAFLMSMAPMDLPDIYRRAPAMESANAWATSPDHSGSGKATLVINPHQRHDGFFQWYEAHLVLGGVNIYGATLRGLPVILQGHNDILGWALSPNHSDFADVFQEEYEEAPSNPKSPRSPSDQNQEQHAVLLHYMSHSVPYRVRVGEGMETRYVPAFIGVRGPMFEHPTLGLHSWCIGGYRDFGGLGQLLEMAAARNLDQFCAALSLQQIPCFHIIYADAAGNIFYLFNTKTGTRIAPAQNQENAQEPPEIYRWDQPLSYKLASMAWDNVIAPDALPYIFNPPSGFIQACGNPPWTATTPPLLDPDAWPPWLLQDTDTYRAKRVRQLLQQGKRSFRDHQSMLFDVVTPAAFDLLPIMLQSAEQRKDLTQSMHPDFWLGIDVLKKWNYLAETTSPGMTFFHLWWTCCASRAGKHYASQQMFIADTLRGVPETQEILLRSVEDAARAMRNDYDTLEQPWGRVHTVRRGSREEPIAGASSGEPVFVASDYDYDHGKWVATYGYGFAMVVQFGETPESVSLMPFGESNVPGSPHFDDQLNLMLARQFKHVRFLQDDILRNAEWGTGKTITLLPHGVLGAITLNSANIMHARMRTEIEAPYPVPPGTVPFSLYMQADRKPLGIPVYIDGTIHIPKDLCDDETFSKLALFRYEPGLDWQSVPTQQQDLTSRNLYMRDNAVAEWYVVLGPAEYAEAAEGLTRDEQSLEAHDGMTGLSGLLNAHNDRYERPAQERLFEFQRHDIATDASSDKETTLKPEVPPKGIFKLEKLAPDEKETEKHNASPLTAIPGFHFGPDSKENEALPSTDGGRVFRMERENSSNEKAETIPQDTITTPPAENESTQSEQKVPNQSISNEITGAEATSSDNIPTAPQQSPADSHTSSKNNSQPSTPLPDTIPQDPSFIFGPTKNGTASNPTTDNKSKIFKMEILDN